MQPLVTSAFRVTSTRNELLSIVKLLALISHGLAAKTTNIPQALKVAREVGRWLALGVRSTTLALDPEVVVLGGPLSACGEALRSVFVDALGDVSLTPPEVVLVASSGDAVHRGALLVASDRARTRLVEALPPV